MPSKDKDCYMMTQNILSCNLKNSPFVYRA